MVSPLCLLKNLISSALFLLMVFPFSLFDFPYSRLLSTVSKYPQKSFAGRADPLLYLLRIAQTPVQHGRDASWINDTMTASLMCQGSGEAAATLNTRIILHHLKLSQHITLKPSAC
ncbi:histone H3-like [Platysternon megacephalum]|uniref:Histone H3-like n=1 Tax=Platysternon megacephalum TaxID=55544 RepID=A0A4D9DD65_9SAUR|nr:histone H3-like [Platysternon megacephalum]